MDFNKPIQIFVFTVILLSLFSGCTNEEEVNEEEVNEEENTYCKQLKEQGVIDNYEFPIVPGTPEWVAFESRTEMINACQIPDSILTNMCTHGLIVTYFNYPLIHDILSSNIPQIGYDNQSFNGLAELHKRPDALSEMMDYYSNFDLTKIVELWDKGDTFNAIDARMMFYIAGIIIYQKDILGQSDIDIRKELVKIALSKYDYMLANNYVSWWFAYYSNAGIMGKAMLMSNFTPLKQAITNDPFLGRLINSGCHHASSAQINTIVGYANQFINN